jgi:hypothetical protein
MSNLIDLQYSFNSDIIIREGDGVCLAFNPDTTDIYEFNETGAEVLSLLKKQLSVNDILSTLSKEYGCDEQDIAEDVFLLLERMLELNVIIKK